MGLELCRVHRSHPLDNINKFQGFYYFALVFSFPDVSGFSWHNASELSSLRDLRLDFSITIRGVGSHVPYQSLCDVHAAYMPVTVWTAIRFLPDLSQANDSLLVLMTSLRFRHIFSSSLGFVSITLT